MSYILFTSVDHMYSAQLTQAILDPLNTSKAQFYIWNTEFASLFTIIIIVIIKMIFRTNRPRYFCSGKVSTVEGGISSDLDLRYRWLPSSKH